LDKCLKVAEKFGKKNHINLATASSFVLKYSNDLNSVLLPWKGDRDKVVHRQKLSEVAQGLLELLDPNQVDFGKFYAKVNGKWRNSLLQVAGVVLEK
jgi:hypothetical protein